MEAPDIIVLALYFVMSLAIGLWAGRGEKSTHDFFLGGRRQHWLLASISIIATEVSAVTLIAVPADSFRGDWNYLQAYAGSFLGRILIVYLLLPAFYGGAVTTVYEYLGQRFGPWTRTTASLLFFVSRILGSGIRLLVASVALSEVFGWNLTAVVVGSTAIAMTYATFGGIKAILWTDLFQAALFVLGAMVTVGLLFAAIPGDWSDNLSTAYASGKMKVFTWSGGWNNEKLFWLLALNTVFTTMAAMGTDQDLTQRMLTCPDLPKAQRSLLFNAFATFPIPCIYLLIGTLLHQYYAGLPAGAPPERILETSDRIYPYYIATAVPSGIGLRGLLVAAIFAAAMSSLASALGALASTAVNDIYRPWRGRSTATVRERPTVTFKRARARILSRTAKTGNPMPSDATASSRARLGSSEAAGARIPSRTAKTGKGHSLTVVVPSRARLGSESDEKHYLLVARLSTIFFGVVLIFVALAFQHQDKLLWTVLKLVGLIFGGMLGIFLLGVLTRSRGHDRLNVFAMLSSVAILAGIMTLQEYRTENPAWEALRLRIMESFYVAWPWWIVIGTVWTFALAALAPTNRRHTADEGAAL